MKMSDEEYAEKFLESNPPPKGVDPSDWLRDNPPPKEESGNPGEYWPVDQNGQKVPMNEWGVSELGTFPDSLSDWLKRELRKNNLPAAAQLLEEMEPSQIAQNTREANARLGAILRQREASLSQG